MCVLQEVDYVGVPFVVSDSRMSAVDFSVTVEMERSEIMYLRPSFEADVAGFVKPFSLYVSTWALGVFSGGSYLNYWNRKTFNSYENKASR